MERELRRSKDCRGCLKVHLGIRLREEKLHWIDCCRVVAVAESLQPDLLEDSQGPAEQQNG